MDQNQVYRALFEESKDLIWVIDLDFNLVFANKAYLGRMKDLTGLDMKFGDSVFQGGFQEVDIQKWKAYYTRAIEGAHFELDEQFNHPDMESVQYINQVTLKHVRGDHEEVLGLVCTAKDITPMAKKRSEAIQLMDASLDVFCSITESGHFAYVSEAARTLWGYEPEDLIGTLYELLIISEDIPKTREISENILSGQEVRTFQNRYRRKDGSIAYNLWSARWDDTSKLMYCVARDGKEKVEQEAIIQQREQRFKALVQEGSDMISILDAEGNYIYTSPTTTYILGISPEEFESKSVFEFIHPEDIERCIECLKQIATEKKVIVPPFRFLNGQREWRWIETVLTNMLDNPAVQGLVANSRDITKQKEEEHRLKLLESVITNTTDAVLITETELNEEGAPKIIYVNEAFTKMTGYTQEETLGQFASLVLGPNSNPKEIEKISAALQNWEACEVTINTQRKNGEEFWAHFAIKPVADEKGWYTHWIAIQRDVTEQKNKELENKLVAQISSNFYLETDYLKSTEELCKTIATFGNFDLVELWTSNVEENQMQLFHHYLANPKDELFYDRTSEINSFQKSEGLPGKVWESKTQILLKNIETSSDFVRRNEVMQIGIKSILGIPLISNHQVLGVLTIGTKKEAYKLKRYLDIFRFMESFIGAELKRKLLEKDLKHLFEAIPDIVSVGNFQGKFLTINKAGCELLGYSEEEILGNSFEKFIHPDDLNIAFQELSKLSQGLDTFSFEVRFISKSGSVLWLSWYCKSSVKENLIYSTAKNITEQKKLRELNRQTRRLAKIGSWEVNLIDQTVYWTDEVHVLHETDPMSFVPNLDTAINFYREDFREIVQEKIQKCISTGEQFDYEAVIITANKQERWVRSIGNAEFVEGVCVSFSGSFQDIHERKEAEVRLYSLADNLPGVVFQYHIHPEGVDYLMAVTKGSKEIWGFTAEEVMKNNQLVWDQILAGGNFETVQKSIAESIETKSKWSAQWKYVMPTGEIKTHLGYGSPSFMADGTVIFNSVILDITLEAKNEALLEQVSELAKMGSWEVDFIENKHYWSEVIHAIFETNPNEYDPDTESLIKFYRPDFIPLLTSEFGQCMEDGTPVDLEAVIITTTKREKWVRLICNAEMKDGQCHRLVGSMQDISARKEAETRLQTISQNLPGIIYQYLINPDGTDRVQSIQGDVKQLWGFSQTEIQTDINLLWDQIKKGGHFDDVKASILKSIETKSKWTCRIPYAYPNGEFRTHIGHGTPTFLADGTILFNSIVLDITQEAKNEELIKEVSKIARLGSWEMDMVNQDGDAMYWSPNLFEILELNAEYNPTLARAIALHVGESKERVQSALTNLINTGKEYDEELLVKTGKGNERWIRVIGKSTWVNGKCTKIYGSLQDITERKKAEEEKNSLQTTIENSLNEIYIFDEKTFEFIFVNKGALLNLGYSENEITALTPVDLKPEFALASFKDLISPLINKEKNEILFFTSHRRKDGSLYPVEVHLQLVTNGNNKRFVAIILDITERINAEEEIKFKANLLNTIGQAAIATDLDGVVNYWNKAAENIYGWTLEEAIGRNIVDLTTPEPSREQAMEIMEWLKKGETWLGNFKVRKKDGTDFIALVSNSPVYDKNNNLSGIIGVSTDVSEQVKNEELLKVYTQQLESSNERFEKVTEATKDAIWDWDIVNQTYYRSKAIERFFGKNTSQTISSSDFWKDKFHPEDLENIKRSVESAITDPNCFRWEQEYRIRNEKDELVYVIDQGVIIRDDEGNAIRMVGAMSDISDQKSLTLQLKSLNDELKRYTLELERSNEELEQFAFVTSHDLQEPLRMISSFMDLLKRKYENQLDEKALQYIHFAIDGAKRMKQIILDLLDFSRANRITEEIEPIDLNLVLSDYKQLRRKLITETSTQINAAVLPKIKTYNTVVTQILHALLDNAIKYAKPNTPPLVTINVVEQEEDWEFSVADNGIGIDKQFFEKIFVIFQRLHNKDQFQGTGIGLSIAKRGIEFLNGKIWLTSKVGEGTTFYFTIPKSK